MEIIIGLFKAILVIFFIFFGPLLPLIMLKEYWDWKDNKTMKKLTKGGRENLKYSLKHCENELKIALKKYPESIDYWKKGVKINKKRIKLLKVAANKKEK